VETIIQWWNNLTDAQGSIVAALVGGFFVLVAAIITRPPSTTTQITKSYSKTLVGFIVLIGVVLIVAGLLRIILINQKRLNSNAEWTPHIQEFDTVEMVLVPEGCFTMGSENNDPDERPTHRVCFDVPFWIDRTEVTQRQFRDFNGVTARNSFFSGDSRPVEHITWFEARDFCELRGARLPTEAEWEYAARGVDGLVYPWGNNWDAQAVVWNHNGSDGTANVGSVRRGASWVGAVDMSGNVWEWMSSLYLPYAYGTDHESVSNSTDVRVLRGGSWRDNITSLLRVANRSRFNPVSSLDDLGFRCARS
jgi:formylglycine-generating enzyme required for sulfatase activity